MSVFQREKYFYQCTIFRSRLTLSLIYLDWVLLVCHAKGIFFHFVVLFQEIKIYGLSYKGYVMILTNFLPSKLKFKKHTLQDDNIAYLLLEVYNLNLCKCICLGQHWNYVNLMVDCFHESYIQGLQPEKYLEIFLCNLSFLVLSIDIKKIKY